MMLKNRNHAVPTRRKPAWPAALGRALCAALIVLAGLSLVFSDAMASGADVPATLAGECYVRRGNLEGISWKFDADGGFVLSKWRSEDRGGITFGLYSANFYGHFNPITRLEDSTTYEFVIASIEEAGGNIYDVYYPPSENVESFAEYLPWPIGTTLRIEAPLNPGDPCQIGTPDESGDYTYLEYEPLS